MQFDASKIPETGNILKHLLRGKVNILYPLHLPASAHIPHGNYDNNIPEIKFNTSKNDTYAP
jgi:hypothetical protein